MYRISDSPLKRLKAEPFALRITYIPLSKGELSSISSVNEYQSDRCSIYVEFILSSIIIYLDNSYKLDYLIFNI